MRKRQFTLFEPGEYKDAGIKIIRLIAETNQKKTTFYEIRGICCEGRYNEGPRTIRHENLQDRLKKSHEGCPRCAPKSDQQALRMERRRRDLEKRLQQNPKERAVVRWMAAMALVKNNHG